MTSPGLYDHGARSRNPVSTLWYGVDPLWEKYPDFSPYNYCAGNPVKYFDPDGRGLHGGVTIINESSETLLLGGCTGSNDGGVSEVNYKNASTQNFIKLGPHQSLSPYKKGNEWKAEIRDNETGELIADIYAYDVDYLQLQDGQTLTDVNNKRYSTDVNDKDAETPVSSFSLEKNHPYHKKHGDLKIRAALISRIDDRVSSAGYITFSDNNKEGGTGSIKCDADDGGFFFDWNIFSPSIFPQTATIPHSDEQ